MKHEEEQLAELQASLDALPKDTDKGPRSKLELQVAQAAARTDAARAALDKAYAHLTATRLEAAEAISAGLARDAEAYDGAIRTMVAEAQGVLEAINAQAAEMVNVGPLAVGEEVEGVADGRMQRAKVRRAVDEAAGTYELSLWTVISRANTKYEEGFDTS